jgi:hypothetical protein
VTLLRPVGALITPLCVTVTVRPATVAVDERAVDCEEAATVSETEPGPLPLAALTETQVAALDAVHEQPAVVVIVTVVLPPPPATETVVGETV